jgi:hypothetical protein
VIGEKDFFICKHYFWVSLEEFCVLNLDVKLESLEAIEKLRYYFTKDE